jgi:large subunit ribosomal protein L21
MQAVVKIGSQQFLVGPGTELLVNYQGGTQESISFKEVLLLIDGDKIQVGNPTINNVFVQAKVLGEEKGDKIRVSTYKAKSRLRKTIGFRPLYTKIRIEEVVSGKTSKVESTTSAKTVSKKIKTESKPTKSVKSKA